MQPRALQLTQTRHHSLQRLQNAAQGILESVRGAQDRRSVRQVRSGAHESNERWYHNPTQTRLYRAVPVRSAQVDAGRKGVQIVQAGHVGQDRMALQSAQKRDTRLLPVQSRPPQTCTRTVFIIRFFQ